MLRESGSTWAGWLGLLLLCVGAGARAEEPYARRHVDGFDIGNDRVERTLVMRDGRPFLTRFVDKSTGFDLAGGERHELPMPVSPGPWGLAQLRESRLSQNELMVEAVFDGPSARVVRVYVLYPGSSIVRECQRITNTGAAPLPLNDPAFLSVGLRAGQAGAVDFHWMTGAHNIPGLWNLKTETLRGQRSFDSYDAPPQGPPGPRAFRPGSASYAPWYALYGRNTRQGAFIGFDYFGHWSSRFEALPEGSTTAQISLAGFRRELKPGESITTPWAFVGLFHDDLDNAGNELLDWQYTYLWDYTRDGRGGTYPWFPALRTLGYWFKGTGWGKAGVGWTGGNPDLGSTYRKVFRVADYMRATGTDVYHRDWGWWDVAGDWNGPDFRSTGAYLRKSEMGQLIYAFLYTVNRKSRVAAEHPEWMARVDDDAMTLDLSNPAAVGFMQGQLDSFVSRWGDFEWRNDSTITGERAADPSTLLEQDQNFRKILQAFLEKYPNCGFQAVNGGGNFAGYDYLRYASNVQFSDGAIGPLRNYWSALLFPPDKNCDNPDQWDPARYDKGTWRGLLCFNYDTTGDTIDPEKLEGIRQLNDIYHYLLAHGVVGRWVHVYRPRVEGDDPTMWFERLSRDGKRGILIPKHVPAGPVTVYPKGLLRSENYTVSYQESEATEKLTGAELMERGIRLQKMLPGELIYLNLPLHPGSRLDTTPPEPPTPLAVTPARNMGYPGVELTWKAGRDDNWVSFYEVFRNGTLLERVAKGTFAFDHSAGADPRVLYEIRTVDGAGNGSRKVAFPVAHGRPAVVIDDAPGAGVDYAGNWSRIAQAPAHHGSLSVGKEKGAKATFTVEGQRVLVFVKLGPDAGKLAASIDAGPAEVVNTFSADEIWGICAWEHALSPGRHTLSLTLLGEHDPLSSGNMVHLDGVRVEQE